MQTLQQQLIKLVFIGVFCAGFFLIFPQILFAGSVTFSTAGTSTWFLPSGVSKIEVKLWGAGGAGGGGGDSSPAAPGGGGGGGGFITGSITPTTTSLIIVVGNNGVGGTGNETNGGGGGGGGGYSAIRTAVAAGSSTIIMLAPGGGGGGGGDDTTTVDGGQGGAGGGQIGLNGATAGTGLFGAGGRQDGGGLGGSTNCDVVGSNGFSLNGGAGSKGNDVGAGGAGGVNGGGLGGSGNATGSDFGGGGAGGAGWYGGGGGCGDESTDGAGGGGGGSSFATSSLSLISATSTSAGDGVNAGNNTDIDYAGSAGLGGAGGTAGSGTGTDGNDGRVVINWATSTAISQAAYRFFGNSNSADVGRAGALNTPFVAPAQFSPFRLRILLSLDNENLTQSGSTTKLQFAEKSGTCDTSFSGETYLDVSSTTGRIRFFNNSSVSDGTALTQNTQDPRYGTTTSRTVRNQVYSEGAFNLLSNSQSAVAGGETMLFDFSLVDFSSPTKSSYCFRMVQHKPETDAGDVFGSYFVIPELRTAGVANIKLRDVRLRDVRLR